MEVSAMAREKKNDTQAERDAVVADVPILGVCEAAKKHRGPQGA
jgi:hypothetical protein